MDGSDPPEVARGKYLMRKELDAEKKHSCRKRGGPKRPGRLSRSAPSVPASHSADAKLKRRPGYKSCRQRPRTAPLATEMRRIAPPIVIAGVEGSAVAPTTSHRRDDLRRRVRCGADRLSPKGTHCRGPPLSSNHHVIPSGAKDPWRGAHDSAVADGAQQTLRCARDDNDASAGDWRLATGSRWPTALPA